MPNFDKMDHQAMRDALQLVSDAQDKCLAEWKEFSAGVPRRMNAAQKERSAYLRGRLAGLHQAMRYFESKAPIEIVGS